LDGDAALIQDISDSPEAAQGLAAFLIALQKMDATDASIARRGLPLVTQDNEMRAAIKSLQGVDVTLIAKLWGESLRAPAWDKPPVWIHGDLLPANLLVQEGRLSGVIDFGLCGIGDPACDLIPAWSVFSSKARKIFRESLNIDDATWLRGRGWKLSIACIIIPYYQHTNPGIVAVAERMIAEILVDV
jgi:aminoglycoside phosphotransferase (APT) family kinase protein